MYRFRSPLAFLKVEPMISLFAITGTVYNDRFFFTFFITLWQEEKKSFTLCAIFRLISKNNMRNQKEDKVYKRWRQ